MEEGKEGIPTLGVHKKCNKRKLVKYGGGDVTIWCTYCDEAIYDYRKEVFPETHWFCFLWYWLKGLLGGKK